MDVFDKLVRSLHTAGRIDLKAQSQSSVEEVVWKLILGLPKNVASDEEITELFGASYVPGTFTVGEIDRCPSFLCQETAMGYESWVRREIQRDVEIMRDAGALHVDSSLADGIANDILQLLCHQVEHGKSLRDLIALQEYTDVFRRLTLALLVGDPEWEIDTYKRLNEVGGAIALAAVARLNDKPLCELLKMSLAAGLIGLNLKTSAAATSQIYTRGIIPLDPRRCPDEQVEGVFEQLQGKARETMAIDYWQDYEDWVLRRPAKTVVVFTDDYIETIFDLKFIERQLENNKSLTVCLIPRAGRYGNDASYEDIVRLLEEPVFRTLKSHNQRGRLEVCADGPRLGTVNGFRISQSVANRLKRCDAVFVKGARAYEMLQGIGKHAYFGFAVCREMSEAVTGISADTGALVFIHQRPFRRTFEGFRLRQIRPHEFGSGRRSFLCRVVAKDVYEEDMLPAFYCTLCEQGYRALQARAIHVAPFLDNPGQDLRRGLTLIARPSDEVVQHLSAVNAHLCEVAPGHFYYDGPRFHFTILSLITACEAFDVDSIPLDQYQRFIQETLSAFPPFTIDFMGVGATASSIIARGFPRGGTLEAVRNVLRDRFQAIGLARGIDERYRSRGAHVTLGRLKVVEDFRPMIACLDTLSGVPLGGMQVMQAQLVVNDFYMSPGKVRTVSEYVLSAT